ncbi:hypothetical protein CYLTODRAFT_246949 [Cylindrobasidium torrendii FP15055 ss-10]|uniref:Uncharacterized protein n=1 Tax=Cylindrobasidium torrendii FP15055 ss-10 TaxID=1314674 RepID=A0A0D7BH46_9AGAR|nr:hypothetical protein CYLTODRAFT_246949 [Cylindrobasidium torrendii FP15055 ss-10]
MHKQRSLQATSYCPTCPLFKIVTVEAVSLLTLLLIKQIPRLSMSQAVHRDYIANPFLCKPSDACKLSRLTDVARHSFLSSSLPLYLIFILESYRGMPNIWARRLVSIDTCVCMIYWAQSQPALNSLDGICVEGNHCVRAMPNQWNSGGTHDGNYLGRKSDTENSREVFALAHS